MGDLISRAAAIHAVNAYDYRGFTLDAVRKITDGCAERLRELPSIEAEPVITGETSDGYHTFNELYHHQAVLFSVIVKAFQEKAWKARLHHDGTMYDGMFIVGIDTHEGQASYHYDIDPYWDMFECMELERAPEWDGHTPAQAIERIGKLEPVRHGRWVWNNDAIDWNIGAWVCSECGGRNENIHTGKPGTVDGFVTNPYIWAGSQFCPNCGAKMDGGKDDENA